MLQIILIIVLVVSFLSLLIMFICKVPSLANTPCEIVERKKEKILIKIKRALKKISIFKNFSWNIFLQKILSKIKILTLKIENKIGECILRLRKKSSKDFKDNENNH